MNIRPEFSELARMDAQCEKLAREICRENSLPFAGSRILEGSTILYRTGHGLVVKIFSSEEPEFCRNEAGFLKLLHGRLSVSTPELIASGTHRGYPYIIMEEMRGLPLKALWNDLSRVNRERLMEQTARLLGELHSIPVEEVKTHETNWEEFIRGQIANLEENHRGFGLDERWTGLIRDYIDETEPVENLSKRAVCHTEIMREHLFVTKNGGRPVITGLVDFEPSMVAVPEYDYCAVGLFLSCGEPGLFRRFLNASGYRGDTRGIMRMLLLHRYSNMKWFISTVPREVPAETPEDLRRFWYER